MVRRPGQSRLIIACWASAHESIHLTSVRRCSRRTFSISSKKPGESSVRLVEGDLERESSVAGEDVAFARQRPVVEEQTQKHQPPEVVRGGRRRDEELALAFAARQPAAPAPFPAARLQPEKVAEPWSRVLTALELFPEKPTLLAEALFLSASFLQRQPGDRAAQMALGIVAGLEKRSGRPVSQPERPPPSVQLLNEPGALEPRLERTRASESLRISCSQRIAIGATVEPVAPFSFSGCITKANSYTRFDARSSSFRFSSRWIPLTASMIW